MPVNGETLFVGVLPSKLDLANIKQIRNRADTEASQDGQVVQRWDYITTANEAMLRPSALRPLRNLSDDLADDCVDFLELKPAQDAFKAIQDHFELAEKEGTSPAEAVRRFWDHAHSEVPPEVSGFVQVDKNVDSRGDVNETYGRSATPDVAIKRSDRYGRLGSGKRHIPHGHRPPCLEEGQAVFWRYSGHIFTALMHFSLAGGFSAPNLAAVMRETNYLTSKSRDATYRRLLETTLFVLDAMADMRVGVGAGWRSAVRVRLLHAQVRRRIRLQLGVKKTYDYGVSGVPINQIDLATVLGSFMIAPLWSMRRSGIHLTPFEMSSYQAAWRHVGYYLGCDPKFLNQFYGSSFALAESAFAALAFDAFPEEIPVDGYNTPTYKILLAVSERPPRAQSVEHHLQYSRRLLGTQLADQLALPRASFRHRFSVELDLWLGWSFVTFGRWWIRPGWDVDRIEWFKDVLPLLVLWNLGERRTTFAWRPEDRRDQKLGKDEGEEPGVVMGPAVGKQVRRKWWWLLGEMAFGVASVAVLGGFSVSLAARALYRAVQ